MSELTDFERAVKRHFLCAGYENIPDGIIKDTAKELYLIVRREVEKEFNKELMKLQEQYHKKINNVSDYNINISDI